MELDTLVDKHWNETLKVADSFEDQKCHERARLI